jgi:hypothetical protein
VSGNRVATAIVVAVAAMVTSANGRAEWPTGLAEWSAADVSEGQPTAGLNEPPGMVTQINTGPITSTAVFTVFSPMTPSSLGDWTGNLATVPGETGLRVTYPPTLPGGNSPARWGHGIPSAGTGWYYQRMKVRFSPNWTMAGNVDVKLCEPRTQQTGSGSGPNENDVIAAHDFATQSTHAFLFVALQGPNGHFRNLTEQPRYVRSANLSDGRWHLVEVLFAPESVPGAGNGTYTAWVDGIRVAQYTDVLWLASGNQAGWRYLMFDPTYGGGRRSPPSALYWDFDQLYVSTK